MAFLINNVICDTYAHVDNKVAGDTVIINLEGRSDFSIVAYLFVDKHPFPVDDSLTVECYAVDLSSASDGEPETIPASVGTEGEIVITIPPSLCVDGKNMLCEINISGTDESSQDFRYKATSFRVSIIE